MINTVDLQKLLRDFNVKGYSDKSVEYSDNGKEGKILKLQIDNYTYEDEFYGGEPYSGNETIWEEGSPIFRCVYWGKVAKGINFGDIYNFLRTALSKGPDHNLVHRGPHEYVEGNMRYTNTCEGFIDEFKQVERIYVDSRDVYTAYFYGGRVNTQKE